MGLNWRSGATIKKNKIPKNVLKKTYYLPSSMIYLVYLLWSTFYLLWFTFLILWSSNVDVLGLLLNRLRSIQSAVGCDNTTSFTPGILSLSASPSSFCVWLYLFLLLTISMLLFSWFLVGQICHKHNLFLYTSLFLVSSRFLIFFRSWWTSFSHGTYIFLFSWKSPICWPFCSHFCCLVSS